MKKDNVNKTTKWQFDEEVTQCFTNMISRSIPNYDVMRGLCYNLGKNFIKDGSKVIDMGCSNGLSCEAFIDNFKNAWFYLYDVSEPMLEACRHRFKNNKNVFINNNDLRYGLPIGEADLIISSLTLQFTPIEYRQNILQDVYDKLNVGGAFILVEKVLGNSAKLDNLFVEEYYAIKKDNGYTQEQIANKRKSLEGVLVPLTASFNEHLLKSCGFSNVDCFFRCLNFCGWIAIK